MRIKKDSEARKVFSGVLDERTLKNLYSLSRKLKIDGFYGFIKQGKESSVIMAETSDKKIIAIKIYAVESLDFKKVKYYLNADPRYKNIKGNNWNIITFWAKREFKNLEIAKLGNVNCPQPLGVRENVLAMEFLGEDTNPAPRLIDYDADTDIGEKVIEEFRKMYSVGLVHGDLSAYNILIYKNEPYVIDFSQAISKKSSMAEELLRKDVENITQYLNKIGMSITEEELASRIKS